VVDLKAVTHISHTIVIVATTFTKKLVRKPSFFRFINIMETFMQNKYKIFLRYIAHNNNVVIAKQRIANKKFSSA
jgi:hypothetical protein